MSAHTLINKERVHRGIPSLHRSVFLDQTCQRHALVMAQNQRLSHCCETMEELKRPLDSDEAVGQHVQRGTGILAMHQASMAAERSGYRNILCREFTEFGVGTAKDEEGRLYMVQLFRGKMTKKEHSNDPEEPRTEMMDHLMGI